MCGIPGLCAIPQPGKQTGELRLWGRCRHVGLEEGAARSRALTSIVGWRPVERWRMHRLSTIKRHRVRAKVSPAR